LIFFRWTRYLAVLGGLALHTGIELFLGIRFTELQLCYVVFVDWPSVGRGLRALAGMPSEGRKSQALGPQQGGSAAVACIGSLLVAANVACGVSRTDSWPFAQFPTFARIRTGPQAPSLSIVLEGPDRVAREVSIRFRRSAIKKILLMEDGAEKQRKLRGLRNLLIQDGLEARPGDEIALYRIMRSTIPGQRARVPLDRTLLARLPLIEPVATP
jgi:hypothetical protein